MNDLKLLKKRVTQLQQIIKILEWPVKTKLAKGLRILVLNQLCNRLKFLDNWYKKTDI